MKKKKVNKKLAGAFAMLLLSAAMLGTATYAWFTMNKQVTVTGMKLKANAEDGLLISDSTKTNWATSWDVNMSSGAALAPTSAAAVASPQFVSNKSDYYDDAQADQTQRYENLTLDWSIEAPNSGSVGSVTVGTKTINYVLKRTFYIKSAGSETWKANLVIDEVTAEAATSNSGNLNKSLRVLVVANETDAFIYAPISGATALYNWKGTAAGATAVAAQTTPATDSTCTHVTSIPITDAGAIKVEMYMYFEGEDANCKSSNISGISVDELTVSAKFKTSDGPAD